VEFRRRRHGLHPLERTVAFTTSLLDRHIRVDGVGLHQIFTRLDDLGRVGRYFDLGFSRGSLPERTVENFGGDGARTERTDISGFNLFMWVQYIFIFNCLIITEFLFLAAAMWSYVMVSDQDPIDDEPPTPQASKKKRKKQKRGKENIF
jgi:hypothetical protein